MTKKIKDHTTLSYFKKADELVVEVYRKTERMDDGPSAMPARRNYYGSDLGLRDSIRSETTMIAMSIIDGCSAGSRRGDLEDLLYCAHRHAVSARYLITVAGRLNLIENHDETLGRFDALLRELDEALKEA